MTGLRSESSLRALRRITFGTVADASKALGISRWTLHRAENGGAVGPETRSRLEQTFNLPWHELMRPFIDQIAS